MSLARRLDRYSATTGHFRISRHWKRYAAVTGSAVAMATNASADIIYSGLQNIQVGIASATASEAHPVATAPVAIRSQATFNFGVKQDLGNGYVRGAAYLQGNGEFGFLNTSQLHVRKLASGFKISGGDSPFVPGYNLLASQNINTANHRGSHAGWSASKVGFAGFSFQTGNLTQPDYGWVRLEYTVGANGAPKGFEVIDWGYNNTGGAILAGQETGSATVPEPSTGALALLAAGAAAVACIRRRGTIFN